MADREGLLGIFTYTDDLFSALRNLQAARKIVERVFSPLRLPEVHEILGKKPSNVRLITLIGGIVGGVGLTGLAAWAHLSFRLIVSGKPVLPWVPWVIVCFEGVILGGVVAAVASWMLKGHLPRLHTTEGYDPSFSQNRFGVLVACTPDEENEIRKLLQNAGAQEVRHVTW